jgi:hypothetical protein
MLARDWLTSQDYPPYSLARAGEYSSVDILKTGHAWTLQTGQRSETKTRTVLR